MATLSTTPFAAFLSGPHNLFEHFLDGFCGSRFKDSASFSFVQANEFSGGDLAKSPVGDNTLFLFFARDHRVGHVGHVDIYTHY